MDPASIPPPPPRTIANIFKEYRNRRRGVILALCDDVELFFDKCDPQKENLCLYGLPDGKWKVSEPLEEAPPELPEPTVGINFPRDGMRSKDWLALVAIHSDSWLLSVACFQAARFNRSERMGLLGMINDLPTVYEVVTERMLAKDKAGVDGKSKPKLSTKRSSEGQIQDNSEPFNKEFGEEDEGEDEHSNDLCGTCGGNGGAGEFWIFCDICERWFHMRCVEITPAMAKSIDQYTCPSCRSSKKGKQ